MPIIDYSLTASGKIPPVEDDCYEAAKLDRFWLRSPRKTTTTCHAFVPVTLP